MRLLKQLLIFSILVGVSALQAQDRFLDPMFDVQVSNEATYASNISVLTGTPESKELNYMIYQPTVDTMQERPVVVLMHSGTFLPKLVNGFYTGSKTDSVIVYTANELAKRGYVVAAIDYRLGWNPVSQSEPVRTSTLIKAAYRGGVDTKTFVRFLKNSYINEGNEFRIDTSRITVMGYGTGGYNVLTSNFLQRPEEVTDLDKFISDVDGKSYLNVAVDGYPDGKTDAPLNTGNFPDLSSNYQFAVAIEGAIGDISWIDGSPEEAPIIAAHSLNNASAPFSDGAVVVRQSGFVVDVSGPRRVIEVANSVGINEPLDGVNVILANNNDPITEYINDHKSEEVTTHGGVNTTASVDNFLPFLGASRGAGRSANFNWVDSATLAQHVAYYNTQVPEGSKRDVAEMLANDRLSNPNTTNPEGAKMVIDSIIDFMTPRAYAVLNLGSLDVLSGLVDLNASDVEFKIGPNPATNFAHISVGRDEEIVSYTIFDQQGRQVAVGQNEGNRATIDISAIPNGVYAILVDTKSGSVGSQLIIRR